jgi:prepilin-type N-terminal cleavage/methylation domain-containing protein/prepilin-type processing-associated H-X9-DG protein
MLLTLSNRAVAAPEPATVCLQGYRRPACSRLATTAGRSDDPPMHEGELETRHTCDRRGFTLVELLVVILLVVVLAGVALLLAGRMRDKADNATAVLNMRQIGVAIACFMSDNQRLPRFSGTGVSAAYSTANKLTHAFVLQPYLGIDEPSSTLRYAEIFKPPGLKRGMMNGKSGWQELTCFAMYSTNDITKTKAFLPKGTVSDSAGIDVGPFGRTGTGGNPTSEGWNSAMLESGLQKFSDANGGRIVNLSMVPAMLEINAAFPTIKGSWPWPVPSKPVRGDHVNVLYFDWHVGSVKPDYFYKP